MRSTPKAHAKPHQESETLRRLRPLIGLIARQIAAELTTHQGDAGQSGGIDLVAAASAGTERL
jgi:hypothetical protein